MKKTILILSAFFLFWCWQQKYVQQTTSSAQTWVSNTDTGTTTQPNQPTSWSVNTWTNMALVATGGNNTWSQDRSAPDINHFSFDRDSLEILFNLSGNISNTQIAGSKAFFFDSNDGLIKYYEEGKTTKLSWLKFYFPNEKYSKTLDINFNNYKVSTNWEKIAWVESRYYGDKWEIKDVCSRSNDIKYTISKLYMANIDWTDNKFLNEIKRESVWNEVLYIQISLVTRDTIYFNNYNFSCWWFLGPCNMRKLAKMDITTQKVTYITDENQCFAGITPGGNSILYVDWIDKVRATKKIFLKNLQDNKVQTIDWICGISPFTLNFISNDFYVLQTSLNWKCEFDDFVDWKDKEWLIFYSKDGIKIGDKEWHMLWFLSDGKIYYTIDNKYFIRSLKTWEEAEVKFK